MVAVDSSLIQSIWSSVNVFHWKLQYFHKWSHLLISLEIDAKKFKEAFEDCQSKLDEKTEEQESNKLAKELEGLTVKESNEENTVENKAESKDTETSTEDSEPKESETAPSDESNEATSSEDAPEK